MVTEMSLFLSFVSLSALGLVAELCEMRSFSVVLELIRFEMDFPIRLVC